MKKSIQLIVLATILLVFGSMAQADVQEWKVDPVHSGFYFSISHIYATVKGFFDEFEGDIYFDPDNLKESRFDFKVKVKSIDTHNGKRDGHLQSDDFFSADRYPDMRFASSSIMHVKGDAYMVEGTLTIKDVSRKIKVPFTYFGSKTHPFNPKQEVAGFEAKMTIDRFDYHVGGGKFYKMGVVGKDVDVLISIEASRDKKE